MIFENLLALQFFKVHFVMLDLMLGRHILTYLFDLKQQLAI